MSGSFPTSPLPSSVTMRSTNTNVNRSYSQSGKRNVRIISAQKWALQATFPDTLSKDQLMPIFSFLAYQQGGFDTFTITSPDLSTPRGTPTGTPVVNGADQEGRTINTSGWTANTEIFKDGDILKFAGHTKVYMIYGDVNSDGSGDATLVLTNPLLESPADSESITVNDVPFTVELVSDISEYLVRGPLLYNVSIDLLEAY